MRVIAIGQRLLGDRLGAADTFGDVLGRSSRNARRRHRSLGTMHGEEALTSERMRSNGRVL